MPEYNKLPDFISKSIIDRMIENSNDDRFTELNMNPKSNVISGYIIGKNKVEHIKEWLLDHNSDSYSLTRTSDISTNQYRLWITDKSLAILFKLKWFEG